MGLIDLENETIAAIRIKQFVTALARKHDPDAFRQQPQVPIPEAASPDSVVRRTARRRCSPRSAASSSRPDDSAADRRRQPRLSGASWFDQLPRSPRRFDASEGTCVSRWEPTPEELEILKAGGSVELWVCGNQPPVYVRVSADPTRGALDEWRRFAYPARAAEHVVSSLVSLVG